MRVLCGALAVLAAAVMLLTATLAVVSGDAQWLGWLVVGPLPFYLVGFIGFVLRPENLAVRWILVIGSCFAIESCLGDVVLPHAAESVSAGWLMALAMLRHWMSVGSTFGAVGLTATFPSGRPQRRAEWVVLGAAGGVALALPLLNAMSAPTLMPGLYAGPGEPEVTSWLFVDALSGLGPATAVLYRLYPMWVVAGLALLAGRYRTGAPEERRRIRWLLGWLAAVPFVALQMAIIWSSGHASSAGWVASVVLWPVIQVLAIGSLVAALFADGVFGIDEPARRRFTRRALRGLLAFAAVAVAAGLGLIAGRLGGTALAVAVALVAVIATRPAWRALETGIDRWLFGARLDGYDLLARFGASLQATPSPAGLASGLAEAVTVGLGLTWARVTLDGELNSQATTGTVTEPAAAVVPLVHAGRELGRIECGARRDRALLDEDRRLLAIIATQAGVAASTLGLTAELADRVTVIRRQAAELAASRQRVVAGQDVERRRIQQDLHDGVQQEIVALSAKVSLAQQRLGRGDPRAADALAELQRDLRAVLADVREVAYTIHPPILTDRGLVEAVEGQAGRLAVPTSVHADPALRGARFDERLESAAWYSLAEAMSNVVKHADAGHCDVTLRRQNGRLVLSVRDDGHGFDTHSPRGLGLTGMADRLDTVGGSLAVSSSPGAGTTLHMELPAIIEGPDA